MRRRRIHGHRRRKSSCKPSPLKSHHGDSKFVSVADPNADWKKLDEDQKKFDEAYENRSLVGKLLGQTPEEDKKRYEATEKKKDATQIAASVAGVGNYLADVGNIGASLGRSIDAAVGLNRPQSWSDAGQHLQGAGYNTLAVANVVPPAGNKTVDFVKGGKDLVKSLTGQGDKVSDLVTTVGNVGYWFDEETGTVPGIIDQVSGGGGGKTKSKKTDTSKIKPSAGWSHYGGVK